MTLKRKHHHREEVVGEAALMKHLKEALAAAAAVELLPHLDQGEEVVGAAQLHRLCSEGAGVEEEE